MDKINENIKSKESYSKNIYDTMTLNSLYDLKLDFIDDSYSKTDRQTIENKKAKEKKTKSEYILYGIKNIYSKFMSFSNGIYENLESKYNKYIKGEVDINLNVDKKNNLDDDSNHLDLYIDNANRFENISSRENKEIGSYITNLIRQEKDDMLIPNTYYTVDRIEDDFVILENRDTLKMVDVKKDKFNFNINEGDILYYSDNRFFKDEVAKEEIEKQIRDKMNNLWN